MAVLSVEEERRIKTRIVEFYILQFLGDPPHEIHHVIYRWKATEQQISNMQVSLLHKAWQNVSLNSLFKGATHGWDV